MSEPPKRSAKLSAKIIEEFHAAGQRGDVEAFKRLLGNYGAHLPKEVKEQLIADFRKNVQLLRDSLRR